MENPNLKKKELIFSNKPVQPSIKPPNINISNRFLFQPR